MIIEITKVPISPAPEEVSCQWVGVRMEAERMPTGILEGLLTRETDLVSGQALMFPRGGFSVSVETALTALATKSSEAADWFRQNNPPRCKLFSFGSDEAEIIEEC
jgi:hypothetical protein